MSQSIAPVLTGRLRRATLPPFFEFLAASNHTGAVNLEGPGEFEGVVVVRAGAVTHAACAAPGGVLQGLDALRAMLRWRYAYIEVLDTLPTEARHTVKGSILHVLLEAARLEDEAARERELPAGARVRLRHNVAAYEGLAGPELALLAKVRPDMTVSQLRRELPGLPVDSAMLELIEHGMLELEGAPPPPQRRDTAESQAILAALVPVRARRYTGHGRTGARALNPVHETIFSLVDGLRTADDIRRELRMAPGQLRAHLQALRSAGRIDY